MKKLDLYIIKRFLLTFFYILGIIMSIAIIFDVSEKVDDFLSKKPPFMAVVIDYYFNFFLYYGNLFSSLLIFIAVIFFTAQLASRTEIVAILSSGVSFKRLLLPYFIAASILATISFYLNNWMIPHANEERLAFEEIYIKDPYKNLDQNIHKQISPGTFIYFSRYNAAKDVGYNFSIEKWEGNNMTYKLISDYARFDTATDRWTIENYQIRTIDGTDETMKLGRKLDTLLGFTNIDFERRNNSKESMDYATLNAFIEQSELEGSERVPDLFVEKYQRTSYPFATYILTLIGVTIASRKVRGGIGLHIAAGLALAVLYILFMKVATVYATKAGLDPLIAVWLPNALFGAFSIYLLRRAPK